MYNTVGAIAVVTPALVVVALYKPAAVVVGPLYDATVVLGSSGVKSDSPLPSKGIRPDMASWSKDKLKVLYYEAGKLCLPIVNNNSAHVSVMGIENWEVDLMH